MSKSKNMLQQAERMLTARQFCWPDKRRKPGTTLREIESEEIFQRYKQALGRAGEWAQQHHGINRIDHITLEIANDYLQHRIGQGISQENFNDDRNIMQFIVRAQKKQENDSEKQKNHGRRPECKSRGHTKDQALCGKCNGECRLTDGKEVYPHRADLYEKHFYICDECTTFIGCHPGTTTPLGMAADRETRRARMLLHQRMLDPLWKNRSDGVSKNRARSDVYRYLAHELKLAPEDSHTGLFSLERCRDAWIALRGQTPETIAKWNDQKRLVDGKDERQQGLDQGELLPLIIWP